MSKEFRRKPNRKSIIKADSSRAASWEDDDVEHSRERKSTNIKRQTSEQSLKGTHRGRVIGTRANLWHILPEENTTQYNGEYKEYVECHVGGLALTSNTDATLVTIGDYVRYLPDDKADDNTTKGVIIEVEPRNTKLVRKVAGNRADTQVICANVDQVIIVNAAAEPFYNRRSIDRYLIAAEQGGLRAIIVINKIELMDEDALAEDLAIYTEQLGIPLYFTSCTTGYGISELREEFSMKTSVLAGPSGVGKSSLINSCFGFELQAVGEISEKFGKGKHTTTAGRLFALHSGDTSGALLDTPGMREFGITDIHPDDVPFFFHDFDEFYPNCKYLPCTHTHEPDCAVKVAVEEGMIDPQRYDSYLRILESMV